jgi:hypothetical protein
MKTLQESILGSTKSGKNKLFADNPELHLKDIFASDELEMRLINGTKNKYTVYGSTPKKEIEIDESWPDIEITWLSITTNHGHQLTYKIKGQKSFDKFLSIFAPSGSSSEYLGSYHGIPSFDTKFIIENCTVIYDKLPLLAGVVKLKNVKFKMQSNHWVSRIKGELRMKNCGESELPPVFTGLTLFKKS